MTESPDGRWRADLVLAGEIRFGPFYYTLQLNGRTLVDRIFGEPLVWSPDSRLLAVQEWLTTDYGIGPRTQAVLIRPEDGAWTALGVVEKGFAEPLEFEGGTFRHRQAHPGRGNTVDCETALSALASWQAGHWATPEAE